MKFFRTAGRYLAVYWYVVCTTLAVAAFLSPLLMEGDPGFHAAILAMCLAATMITEIAYMRKERPRRLPALMMGLMALAGAYLWIADEAGTHPADILLLGGIGLVFLASAVFAGILAIFVLIARWS